MHEEVHAAIKSGGGKYFLKCSYKNKNANNPQEETLEINMVFFAALQMTDFTILLLITPHKRLYLSLCYKNPLRMLKSPDLNWLYKPPLEKVPGVET